MKKFLSLFLCLTCVLTLVACGKKVAPITLPQTDEITSIDITFGENTVSHSDKTWISEIIADISSSEPTKKESVQDCPQVESYIKIDFQFETGTSTIFAYEDSGNTILNSLIKEFIKLIANYSKGYKKLINSSLPPTHRVNLSRTFTTKYPPPTQRHTEQEI